MQARWANHLWPDVKKLTHDHGEALLRGVASRGDAAWPSGGKWRAVADILLPVKVADDTAKIFFYTLKLDHKMFSRVRFAEFAELIEQLFPIKPLHTHAVFGK